MNQNLYKILVKNRDGLVIADISDYCTGGREFTWIRNRASKIRLSLDINALNELLVDLGLNVTSLFRINSYEIWVYRNTNLVIAGQISWKSLREDSGQSSVEIEAVGWLDLLDNRVTPNTITSYINTDIGEIIWDLIDTTQNNGAWADIGMTRGVIQPSRNADRNYEMSKIKGLLINLTEVINSPDLYIAPDKSVNVFYPKQGARRNNITLTYPGNIRELSYESNGLTMANKIIATGSGNGINALSVTANSLDDEKKEYGLREDFVSYPDVSKSSTLSDHANDELRSRIHPMILPVITLDGTELTPFIDYGLGDEIEVKVLSNQAVWSDVVGYVRIEAISISVDENNYEKVNLEIYKV